MRRKEGIIQQFLLLLDAKFEDLLKFARTKLQWNERQYVKPIEGLNKFTNDDKHAISQR